MPPTHKDLQNADYAAWRAFLRASEGWSAQTIAEHQLAELQRVVRLAYERTPGYRQLFDAAGVGPNDLRAPEDLERFPCVSKETLRDHLAEFSIADPANTYVTTSGSTGIPFGMYRDPAAFPKELASKAHQYARVGWAEGDRQMVLRGLVIDTPDQTQFLPEFNEYRCSSYHLTSEHMERYRRLMLEYRPEWLRCYPSHGCLFARFLQETGREFPPLKGILCASENLYGFQKHLLSEVFGTRVFSHYGHYELAVLAGFCERADTYHVLPQYGYARLLDESGRCVTEPGGVGEIVATSFIMAATPFVRYRTRDFAELQGWSCPECGRPYQVWKKIEGRLQEFIVTGSGRLISMTAVNMHDGIFDHLLQFQFHQKEKGRVSFHYVPGPGLNTDILTDIAARLRAKLGADTALTLVPVASIPAGARNKHRFLIQELPVEYHDA